MAASPAAERYLPKRKTTEKSVEAMKDLDQSKLKDLDDTLRDTHLLAPTTMLKKPFKYLSYLKDLKYDQTKSNIRESLPAEARRKIKTIQNITSLVPPVRKTFEPKIGECCCKRPSSFVICYFCQYKQEGRKMVKCLKHPLSSYLSDVKICPNCRINSFLIEKPLG